ncbi:hypothetical protein [Entomobacter blattae]|uniref:Uncharacterized protein n=1 Tax=Entomobacter blattae TaxID=2762277 RepID=A0A7H1NQZ6_9PROT|nr:hypothetical protein [Entomobacter blattae]QNT78206.1 hypothetical protein JGUZn3_09750 [Entomobacter blattae]
MPNTPDQASIQKRIYDLKVTGHLMTLDPGLYCIFHTKNQKPADDHGFPGIRISLPPFLKHNPNVQITGFEGDGWIGAEKGALLVQVSGKESTQVLVTIYQDPSSAHPVPSLQVVRLNDAPDSLVAFPPVASEAAYHAPAAAPVPSEAAEAAVGASAVQAPAPRLRFDLQKEGMKVVAHLQMQGDVALPVGEWMGTPGSQHWIEGFGIIPPASIAPEDIEYQAVLGKGWYSPWQEGGKFCGSRGMALPILGLAVRLKGKAAEKYICRLTASFIDGTHLGPVTDGEPVSSYTLAPLESFRLEVLTHKEAQDNPVEPVMMPQDVNLVEEQAEKSEKKEKPVVKEISSAASSSRKAKKGQVVSE